ncbi:Neprilysin 5 [Carabus blaptoides fortunei]
MSATEQNGAGQIFSIHRYAINNSVAPAGSANNLVGQRSKTAELRKKIEHDRKFTIILFVICIILAIIVIALAASYVITRNKPYAKGRICESEKCIRSAANLRLAMNTSVNPCDDFYQYTCGRWTAEHPDHGWFVQNSAFAILEEKIAFATLKFFQSNASAKEPEPVKQSRNMYKACMDQDAMDKIGYTPVFKYLSMVGLPAFPTFMNLSDDPVDIATYNFDWLKTEVALAKILNLQVFIGFDVVINVFNTSQNCLLLGVPSMTSPLPGMYKASKRHNPFIKFDEVYADKDSDDHLSISRQRVQAYKDFVSFVITSLVKANYSELPDDFDETLEKTVKVIIEMQIELSDIRDYNSTNNGYYLIIPEEDLQNATNKMLKSLGHKPINVWRPYLTNVFAGTNVTLDLDKTDLLYVEPDQLQYLFMIVGFLASMPDIVVELFVWWMTVKSLIMNTTSEVTELYDKLFSPFLPALLRSRAVNCAVLVNDFMGMAVSYAIADKSFLNETKPRVEQMLGDIKEAFEFRLNHISWMDAPTKQVTLEKSNEMISFIGFPDWFLQEGALETYYSNVTIYADRHLENMIGIILLYVDGILESLRDINEKTWHSDPTTVNAYNDFLDNTITVPMAMLLFPVYNLGLEVLNYGAIGSILGHELTHGFDNNGRKYDKYGNYRQWWSNSTIDHFENLTKCFINQYSEFYVPEVDDNVDGELTLGENIADNGGVNHAFLAYKNYKKRQGPEPLLPGFEQFTDDQLFFIAYASMWCDETSSYILENQLLDEHSPNRYRVLGSLSNSEDFSKAFHCPKGSNMNPNKKKCRIW